VFQNGRGEDQPRTVGPHQRRALSAKLFDSRFYLSCVLIIHHPGQSGPFMGEFGVAWGCKRRTAGALVAL